MANGIDHDARRWPRASVGRLYRRPAQAEARHLAGTTPAPTITLRDTANVGDMHTGFIN